MEREEFERRALVHLDAVTRMARQLARADAEVADLVQETFLRAWRAADRFEERSGGMKAWLFRILHNTFFSEVERARRRPLIAEPDLHPAGERPLPEQPGGLRDLAGLDWERVDERLKAAVAELRPEQREVLLLWAVEGLKYREIAEILEVPIGTVMSRLHRARATLIAELAEFTEERRLPGGS